MRENTFEQNEYDCMTNGSFSKHSEKFRLTQSLCIQMIGTQIFKFSGVYGTS